MKVKQIFLINLVLDLNIVSVYKSIMTNSREYEVTESRVCVDDVARSLLQLKSTMSRTQREGGLKYKSLRQCYEDMSPTKMSMSLIVAVENSAWRRMFQRTTFHLRMMREIVRNVLCYECKQHEYPHIEGIIADMQNVHTDGYVVMKQTVTSVLQQLRHVIQKSYDNTVLFHKERQHTYAKLVCNVLVHLNKYETFIWKNTQGIQTILLKEMNSKSFKIRYAI